MSRRTRLLGQNQTRQLCEDGVPRASSEQALPCTRSLMLMGCAHAFIPRSLSLESSVEDGWKGACPVLSLAPAPLSSPRRSGRAQLLWTAKTGSTSSDGWSKSWSICWLAFWTSVRPASKSSMPRLRATRGWAPLDTCRRIR